MDVVASVLEDAVEVEPLVLVAVLQPARAAPVASAAARTTRHEPVDERAGRTLRLIPSGRAGSRGHVNAAQQPS